MGSSRLPWGAHARPLTPSLRLAMVLWTYVSWRPDWPEAHRRPAHHDRFDYLPAELYGLWAQQAELPADTPIPTNSGKSPKSGPKRGFRAFKPKSAPPGLAKRADAGLLRPTALQRISRSEGLGRGAGTHPVVTHRHVDFGHGFRNSGGRGVPIRRSAAAAPSRKRGSDAPVTGRRLGTWPGTACSRRGPVSRRPSFKAQFQEGQVGMFRAGHRAQGPLVRSRHSI